MSGPVCVSFDGAVNHVSCISSIELTSASAELIYQLILTKPTWVPDRLVTIHPNLNLYLVRQSDLAVEGSVEGNAQAGATSPIGHACFCRAEVTAL